MYCPNCGKLNPQEDKFCMYCGAELIDNQSAAQPSAAAAPRPVGQSIGESFRSLGNLARRHLEITIPAAVILLLVVVYAVLDGVVFSPKNAVVNYVEALRSQDTQAIYDATDLPESEFTTYDNFLRMWSQMGSPSLTASSYEVTEASARRASTSSVDPLALMLGLSDAGAYLDDDADDTSTSMVKTYLVNYHVSGSDQVQTMQVQLISEPRLGGLFSDYKVLSSYVVQDYTVTVPSGAAVTVDGIALTDGRVTADGDVYTIPAIFQGDHTIQVESTLGGLSEDVTLSPSGESGYTCRRIPYSEATGTALFEQAKTQINAIMAGALARQSWPADVAVSGDPDEAEDVAYTYQRLQENLFDTDRGSGYTSFQFTEVTDESDRDQTFSAEEVRYTCVLDFRYNYTRRYVSWNDDVEMKNGSSSGVAYLDYVYNNGSWQLASLSIGY